jgi:L-seryl-tRNA(Ser) seleniumtransferase
LPYRKRRRSFFAMSEIFRQLPSVDQILAQAPVALLLERYRREGVVAEVRRVLDRLRAQLVESGEVFTRQELLAQISCEVLVVCSAWQVRSLRRVINATGVVLHTGLGRAPLAHAAQTALVESASYTNLELDLPSGRRGERVLHVEQLVCAACGAEAVAVVNNNAAAVLIALNTLASGRQVLVSRGQMVEIGGSFRIPDVIAASGAELREVGTTNRTHLRDYEAALNADTGAILVVHPSNYRVLGFTAEVELENLAALARRADVPLVYDLGGGVLCDLAQWSLPSEPVVKDELKKGADLVTFSGDKVLGGPQAGLIAGARDHVEAIRKNALMRALRCDKLVYAALEATLALYRLKPEILCQELPVLRMLCAPLAELEARAERLAEAIGAACGERVGIEIVESLSQAGSGALPLEDMPSRAVVLKPREGGVETLARSLRTGELAVVGRIEHERLLLDMRTIATEDEQDLVAALRVALV